MINLKARTLDLSAFSLLLSVSYSTLVLIAAILFILPPDLLTAAVVFGPGIFLSVAFGLIYALKNLNLMRQGTREMRSKLEALKSGLKMVLILCGLPSILHFLSISSSLGKVENPLHVVIVTTPILVAAPISFLLSSKAYK